MAYIIPYIMSEKKIWNCLFWP